MEMWAGGLAGRADDADGLAGDDLLPDGEGWSAEQVAVRVVIGPGCRTSAYQPQPFTAGDPSRSQECERWFSEALQTTRVTTPAAAALMMVPLGAAMSMPLVAA